MSLAAVVPFPAQNQNDIPNALRRLADGIEAGNYGDAHNIAFVIDCGDSAVRVGLYGATPVAGSTAHFLLHAGASRLMAHITDVIVD